MKENETKEVQEAVIEKAQDIFTSMKEKLSDVECPTHGKALLLLEQDKVRGGVKIETCCPEGEKLVAKAIENL
ncbi:hypothetical protein HBN50_02970 [Halobacteriovorax sp. GB3]|uniref:hypothetical protein n=1 Tax=Halobacteriovorax sp. GB3 TaxID=2719615 RepID=UPI00235E26A5|nr:hypothetical protein [Halobacteriovorax sp. GB3]MDD0852037.1 hypothetical protein [Halobacteriovorax sp. GB3]